MPAGTIRTTVSLPEDLVFRADRAVRDGAVKSRNELLANALRHEVELLERQRVDGAFAGMADDEDYLREAEEIAEHFADSDRDALRESESRG